MASPRAIARDPAALANVAPERPAPGLAPFQLLGLKRGLAAIVASLATLGLGVASAQAAPAAPASQTGGVDADAGASGPTGTTGTTGASGSTQGTTVAGAGAPVTLTRAQARRVQKKLGVRADGAFGSRSRAALKRWERRQGLPADGQPDSEGLRRMGVALTAAQKQAVAASSGTAGTTGTGTVGTTGASGATGATGPASAAGQTAVQAAMGQVGQPYKSAGTGAGGFDCSGLTQFAFAQAGIDLPHSSFDQFTLGVAVAQDQIQAGDLVFFDSAGPGASDVGIATSPTETVSATTKGVKVHPTFDAYWGGHFVGARRVG